MALLSRTGFLFLNLIQDLPHVSIISRSKFNRYWFWWGSLLFFKWIMSSSAIFQKIVSVVCWWKSYFYFLHIRLFMSRLFILEKVNNQNPKLYLGFLVGSVLVEWIFSFLFSIAFDVLFVGPFISNVGMLKGIFLPIWRKLTDFIFVDLYWTCSLNP